MAEPAFTETLQIGIVVRDLEATVRRYSDDFGIGPWQRFEFTPENAPDLHEHGEPAKSSWRLATATVGQVQWELIEPLDDQGIYARFLTEKGGGVHHIAVASRAYDELVSGQKRKGKELALHGTFSGVEVAYLDTERDLGVLVEIFSGQLDAAEDR